MKSHAIIRLEESLYNTPHLITAEALSPILKYVSHRNSPDFMFTPNDKQSRPAPTNVNTIGEISIDGALTYKPVMGLCGDVGTSYQGILEDAKSLIDSGITTLITTHSSGGGQASHMMDTADQLRAMCDEAGIKWYSYIDTMSASASLGLGIAADEVIIHPDGETGSIGCVLALCDVSKKLEMDGIKPIYITSTDGKVPYAEDGSFTKEFLQKMQEDVSSLGLKFAEHVQKYSGISVADIQAMNAQMFNAEEALKLGLVNKIMTHKQFLNYIETT